MDHESFDRLACVLGNVKSRRAVLGALLGTGLAGTFAGAEAAKKDRNRKHRNGKKGRGKAQVSAQAANCLSPGPGSNISDCDYTSNDFSGQDLSSSRMVDTIFRDADLVKTDLSSSNAKRAVFRGAEMFCADLRSSVLGGANFRDADLTLANMKSSSGCKSATFTAGTTFCRTIMCDGSVRNDDCPDGTNACCSDANCGPGEACINNACVAVCNEPFVGPGVALCSCLSRIGTSGFACVRTSGGCSATCTSDAQCSGGTICTFSPCCFHPEGVGTCHPACAFPDDCTCTSGRETCDPSTWVRCGANVL